MDDEKRAGLIKRLVFLVLFAGAVAAGIFVDLSSWFDGEKAGKKDRVQQVDQENFRRLIAEDRQLTVMNLRLDGNPSSEKLGEIIKNLEEEKTFADQVVYTELDTEEEQDLAKAQKVDFKNYQGRLDFYAAGYRLGSLNGPADQALVEETIQRYLDGLVKRFGPGWLPEVEGMNRGGKDSTILKVEPADPPKPPKPKQP